MSNKPTPPGQGQESTKRSWESPELIEETISAATRHYFSTGIDNYERTAPHYGS
ncbi:MAG: hypothetical protein ACAH11_10105 [Sphingomonas sp.]